MYVRTALSFNPELVSDKFRDLQNGKESPVTEIEQVDILHTKLYPVLKQYEAFYR
jgi:hypothetical protein